MKIVFVNSEVVQLENIEKLNKNDGGILYTSPSKGRTEGQEDVKLMERAKLQEITNEKSRQGETKSVLAAKIRREIRRKVGD